MLHNFMPEIKEYLNGKDEDLIKLFYVIDDARNITDLTELSKIINTCENIGMDYGVTLYDIISGKIDSDFVKMLDLKIDIDDYVNSLPFTEQKSKKKVKEKSKDKIIKFKKDDN